MANKSILKPKNHCNFDINKNGLIEVVKKLSNRLKSLLNL